MMLFLNILKVLSGNTTYITITVYAGGMSFVQLAPLAGLALFFIILKLKSK